MIRPIKNKDKINFIDFSINYKDKYFDGYITINKERKFLSEYNIAEKVFNNIIKKGDKGFILDNNGKIRALLLIIGYSDKFPRKYVKLLAENSKYTIDMLKFLKWNYFEKDLYAKFKKENPLSTMIIKTGFIKIGDRGRELLFFKKGLKQLYPITPKDEYLKNEDKRLY